jgi:FkbM family methyltransferase
MRNLWENPFIGHECSRFEIDKAPINTNIYETYAQCNEDLIIEAVLRAQTQRSGRGMDSVRYIEIGANHPIQTSSTYLLYKVYGASGILVEPIPRLAETLKKIRPNDTIVNCAITTSDAETVTFHIHEKNELSSVSPENIARFANYGGVEKILETITCKNMHINEFLRTYGSGRIDYMSVDIEGLDIDVIMAMDSVFQPTIMQIEHNGRIDLLSGIMRGKGYGLLGMTDVNVIYVRSNLI